MASAARKLKPSHARVMTRVALPALLGFLGLFVSARAPHGSGTFYAATLFTAAVYLAAWWRWGDRRAFSPPRPGREALRGIAIGAGLLALFVLGAFLLRYFPFMTGSVHELLDNARVGPLAMTLLTTTVNGLGEEMFFRDVIRRTIPRQRGVGLILYLAVTAAMGVPLLLLAALIVGGAAQYEARRSAHLISPLLLHLTWSIGMLFALSPILTTG